jgi:hypothetical protein
VARYLAAWFPMILIAVANGALREAWLMPRLGDVFFRLWCAGGQSRDWL